MPFVAYILSHLLIIVKAVESIYMSHLRKNFVVVFLDNEKTVRYNDEVLSKEVKKETRILQEHNVLSLY